MRRVFAIVVLGVLVAGACGGDDDAGGDTQSGVSAVAAFYPLAEAIRQVGGDAVTVDDLTPAGAEPHDLELTPDRVDALEDADLVVVMGHGFQPGVEEVVDRRDGPTVQVLDALGVDSDDDDLDPHVWLDPTMMRKIVAAVEAALAQADPARASTYAANAKRYQVALSALDRDYTEGLDDCERDEIVTAHAAFGWLARRYGLEQHSISGVTPDAEPNADRIAELADLAETDGVTTIFSESLVSPEVAETLAQEAGGLKVDVLNPLEGLTDDEVEAGADYISAMRDNLRLLQAALGCPAT